jgi:hypothetical protein
LVWSVGVSVDEVVGDVRLFAESVEVDFFFFELVLRFFLLV